MLTLGLETDAGSHARSMESIRRALISPASNDEGIGAGIQEAVRVYAGAMRQRYNAAAAGDGTWKPLAKSTVARKRKLTTWPERILYLTGALYTSLVPGEPGNIFTVESDRVIYGTSVPYARYHQKGGGRLPQRTLLTRPTQELLDRCIAPIVAAWQQEITQRVASSRIAA